MKIKIDNSPLFMVWIKIVPKWKDDDPKTEKR